MERSVRDILLGYEVGTGRQIAIPVRHLAVTGQTQESGKTTTLEALVARSGLRAIAFVTKRGERAFAGGRRIQPYFRDRADWQFVDQLLEAQLHEKNKFLRPWIIRICRTTRTLADVQREVRRALLKAKGINEGVYTQLDAYLELIVPELGRARLADRIALEPGLNVMDVSGFPTPMQMLFVQSALEWVGAHEEDVVTIIPEAWEFIPELRGSPAKAAAVGLLRKGAGLRNYVWIDSQDMAGVAKEILRGCAVWLIGVQREANELKRNLANIPASIKRPSAAAVATLGKGQFYACWAEHAVKVYVQPVWMKLEEAQAIARGARSVESVAAPAPQREEEETVKEEEAQRLRDDRDRLSKDNADLRRRVAELEAQIARVKKLTEPKTFLEEARKLDAPPRGEPVAAARFADLAIDALGTKVITDKLYETFRARFLEDDEVKGMAMTILTTRPELEVQLKRQVVTVDGDSGDGWIGRLIAAGFFDQAVTGYSVFLELQRRGARLAKPSAYSWSDAMVRKGFLTKEGKEGYRAVQGMKVNLVET